MFSERVEEDYITIKADPKDTRLGLEKRNWDCLNMKLFLNIKGKVYNDEKNTLKFFSMPNKNPLLNAL